MFVFGCFLSRDCVGYLLWLFLWLILLLTDVVVFVIDFAVYWSDCLFWLFCWTVVILWERRKIMVGRCIATLLLLNLTSKWMQPVTDGCLSFDVGVYCLLWKCFRVLNDVLWTTQARIVWRTATDTFFAPNKQRFVSFCFCSVGFMAQTASAKWLVRKILFSK